MAESAGCVRDWCITRFEHGSRARQGKRGAPFGAAQHDRGRRLILFECCAHAAWCFFDVSVFRGASRRSSGAPPAALQTQYTFNKYVTLRTMGVDGAQESARMQASPITSDEPGPIDAFVHVPTSDVSFEREEESVGQSVG